jgi:hypothetical protein
MTAATWIHRVKREVTHGTPRQVIIPPVVIAVLASWLLLSVLTAAGWAAVARGGLQEDRLRGYLTDRR